MKYDCTPITYYDTNKQKHLTYICRYRRPPYFLAVSCFPTLTPNRASICIVGFVLNVMSEVHKIEIIVFV